MVELGVYNLIKDVGFIGDQWITDLVSSTVTSRSGPRSGRGVHD